MNNNPPGRRNRNRPRPSFPTPPPLGKVTNQPWRNPNWSCPSARSASCSARKKPPRRRQKRRFPEKGKKLPSLWTPRTLRKPWTTGIPRIPAHSKKNRASLTRPGETGMSVFPGPKLPVRLGYAPSQQIRQCPFRAGVCSVLQG